MRGLIGPLSISPIFCLSSDTGGCTLKVQGAGRGNAGIGRVATSPSLAFLEQVPSGASGSTSQQALRIDTRRLGLALGTTPRKVGRPMLENRSQRRPKEGGNGASSSRGVNFPADLNQAIEEFVETNFPEAEWPKLRVGQVLTALMYAGVQNPSAVEIVTNYITMNGPNTAVDKVAKQVANMSDEDKQALIRRLGLA
jgi:hypothetical protein